jgi:hypothetical protein
MTRGSGTDGAKTDADAAASGTGGCSKGLFFFLFRLRFVDEEEDNDAVEGDDDDDPSPAFLAAARGNDEAPGTRPNREASIAVGNLRNAVAAAVLVTTVG